jgi:hypothetical protein
MVKGRLDQKASTATGYGWIVWEKDSRATPLLSWIPACRKQLEQSRDYEKPNRPPSSLVEGRKVVATTKTPTPSTTSRKTLARGLRAEKGIALQEDLFRRNE